MGDGLREQGDTRITTAYNLDYSLLKSETLVGSACTLRDGIKSLGPVNGVHHAEPEARQSTGFCVRCAEVLLHAFHSLAVLLLSFVRHVGGMCVAGGAWAPLRVG